MDRSTKAFTEERIVDVQEVNMSNYSIIVTDQYDTTINLSLQYQDPLTAIPVSGERWTILRKGSQWFLGRRAEKGDESTLLTGLNPGDRRIEAQGILYLNGSSILFNGNSGLPTGSNNDILYLNGTTWSAGKLTDANVSSSAAINVTKLSNPSDATKFLRGDGTWAVPPTPTVSLLNANASTVLTASTNTEITLYTYTVPAGTMGTNKAINVRLLGKGVNRAGGGILTLRLYWGGGVIYTATFNAVPSANDGNFDIWIANQGATNSQVISGMLRYFQNATSIEGVITVVDTASNQDVKITAQWNNISATNDFQKYYAFTTLYG